MATRTRKLDRDDLAAYPLEDEPPAILNGHPPAALPEDEPAEELMAQLHDAAYGWLDEHRVAEALRDERDDLRDELAAAHRRAGAWKRAAKAWRARALGGIDVANGLSSALDAARGWPE